MRREREVCNRGKRPGASRTPPPTTVGIPGAREGCSLPLTARAEQSPAPTHIPFPLRGFGGTPDSKVEQGQ